MLAKPVADGVGTVWFDVPPPLHPLSHNASKETQEQRMIVATAILPQNPFVLSAGHRGAIFSLILKPFITL